MAFQRGPGEGYRAAKDAALALHAGLVARALYWNGKIDGYVVETPAGHSLGNGRSAREAWGAALARLQRTELTRRRRAAAKETA